MSQITLIPLFDQQEPFSTLELPLSVNEPFSIIINREHVAEISSRIDRKSTNYSFDGTDEIVNYYNLLAWDNSTRGSRMKTNDIFIFFVKKSSRVVEYSEY
ncbi:hypothetical protein Glove_300g118 [Diversispora epigaea]|uniref:Uncharacterized protein n=1 Tax=Diversispora epigaea TaxID=1348612 RepID=A0A397I1H4_9GLOM|nr:hypothetical protein Glove_300g118 [Diversispora epigaea]